MQQYIVQKHDSLWKIAKHHGVTVDGLARANNLKGNQLHLIRIGQKLNIPGDNTQTIDTRLALQFRGLDFSTVKPKKVKVSQDGREELHTLERGNSLFLNIQDHASGLKVWIENIDKKMEQVLDLGLLPIGAWKLNIDSRKVKSEGALQPKQGTATSSKAEVKSSTTHNARVEKGKTAEVQTRAEQGKPVHGLATIYTEANLRLLPGNEKYRSYLIAAAKKHGLTPQSLAALISAEAAKDADGVWLEKSNQSSPKKAQGLAQFFAGAWGDVFKDENSLLYADCQNLGEAALLAKRLEAKYAIDAAASYANLNLRNFEKTTEFAVSALPPEDKAKMAYILHHDGLKGCLRMFNVEPSLSQEDNINKLRKQLGKGDKAEALLNKILKQYRNDADAAYKGWLFTYTDTKINVNNYIVKDSQDFAQAPRTMAQIAKALSSNIKIATPIPAPAPAEPPKPAPPKPVAPTPAPAKPAAKSSTAPAPSTSPAAVPAPVPASTPAPVAKDGTIVWHDPLSVCTLRTAKLSSKLGAQYGWTRSGGQRCHQGIDLAAVPGTPIFAVANGIVYSKKAPSADYAYGNTLILVVGIADLPEPQAAQFKKVNPGASSIGFFYAHLQELPATSPLNVYAGDVIGKTGDTGNAKGMNTIANGAHLHFEVRKKALTRAAKLENRADPLPFIENCTNR